MIDLKCPPRNLDVSDRIDILFDNIEKYIDSESFKNLVLLFHGIDYTNMGLKDKINYLSEFVKIWDFRKSKERWSIQNNDFINKNSSYINVCLADLNLIFTRDLESNPDYILVLGGARTSNFDRPKKAKIIYDLCKIKPSVIALTCDRIISEKEKEYYKNYGYNIETEAQAMSKGMENSFGFKEDKRVGNILSFSDNIHLISANRITGETRANSYDTFLEFINVFSIRDKNILLVTNQPYASYQMLKFMDFALENNLYIESIGCDTNNNLKESNYLQELKSNIDAIKRLSDKYLMEVKHER